MVTSHKTVAQCRDQASGINTVQIRNVTEIGVKWPQVKNGEGPMAPSFPNGEPLCQHRRSAFGTARDSVSVAFSHDVGGRL